jgi:hypothetical protein
MKRVALLAVIGALLFSQPATAACATVNFNEGFGQVFALRYPGGAVPADLNRDGWLDAIVRTVRTVPAGEPGFTLLAGGPGGAWTVIAEVAPQARVYRFTPIDFDGDGDDDIAYYDDGMVSQPDRGFHFLRNDGQAFPEVARKSGETNSYDGLSVGDLDGDGRQELVYVENIFAPSSGVVLRVGANGSVGERRFNTEKSATAKVSDLDDDGKAEVITLYNFDVRILGDDGEGGLTVRSTVRVNAQSDRILVGDFDGNGSRDILVKYLGAAYDLILDAGRPTQRVRQETKILAVSSPNPAVAADIDGDGLDDLLYVVENGLQVLFVQHTGEPRDGGFWYNGLWGGARPGDFDRDGDIDLLISTTTGVSTLLNDGTGTFPALRHGYTGEQSFDLNHDGRDDILNGGAVLLAPPGGVFPAARLTDRPVPFGWTDVADLNRDGELDLLTFLDTEHVAPSRRRLQIRLGDGSGTFGSSQTMMVGLNPGASITRDFTGDGFPDILLINWLGPPRLSLYAGIGDGTFADGIALEIPTIPQYTISLFVRAGDFDRDGDFDLLFGLNTNDGLVTSLNDGHGSFHAPIQAGMREGRHLTVVDVNNDGRDDLVNLGSDFPAGQIVRSYISRGDGTFVEHAVSQKTPLQSIDGLVVRDFNRDGRKDVLLMETPGNSAFQYMELYLGDGGGGFAPVIRIPGTRREKLVGDFDGDGAPDIIDGGWVRLNMCGQARRRAIKH